MGQAKKRGTFEERAAAAQIRNRVTQALINKSKNTGLQTAVRLHGIQRVAARLVATGELATLQSHAEAQTDDREGASPIITPPGYNRGRIVPP